jgi:APA family basic amino acid/polyamine antiporter
MDLFRKKSVDQLVSESTPLKRTLKTFDLTMLGIGAIIGTGIFVLTGKGALTAGPALCISFLLAAVCCGFAGLCYAEFAAMAPVSGSAYSYAYLAFGELIAFCKRIDPNVRVRRMVRIFQQTVGRFRLASAS